MSDSAESTAGGLQCQTCGAVDWNQDGATRCGSCGRRPRRERRQQIEEVLADE